MEQDLEDSPIKHGDGEKRPRSNIVGYDVSAPLIH